MSTISICYQCGSTFKQTSSEPTNCPNCQNITAKDFTCITCQCKDQQIAELEAECEDLADRLASYRYSSHMTAKEWRKWAQAKAKEDDK